MRCQDLERIHDSLKEIWGMVLWVRHLAQLSPPEKEAIESRERDRLTEQHEKMMNESHSEKLRRSISSQC